ncbi:MAG: sulfatase-like hydrolase/transferase [Gammaproteobacteria bacterium]|nr:sulfatase-like hydrolase/transferase [Gammaproteobacteria bacterium]
MMISLRRRLLLLGGGVMLSWGMLLLARLALLTLYSSYFSSLGWLEKSSAFFYALRFDFSVAATLFFIPALLMFLPFRWAANPRWLKFLAYLVFLLLALSSFFLIADLIYFDYVQRHIGPELAMLASDWLFVLQVAQAEFLLPSLLFLSFLLLAFFYFQRCLNRYLQKEGLRQSETYPRLGLVFVGLFLGFLLIARGGTQSKPVQIIQAYALGSEQQANLILNGLFTAIHSYNRSASAVNYHFFEQDKKQQLAKRYGLYSAEQTPFRQQLIDLEAKPLNVVLILVESLSYQYVDALAGQGYGVTPVLDRLVSESRVYDRFYAAGQRSFYGIQAALTGIPIMRGLPYLGTGLELSRFSKLGVLAKQEGYSTLLLQSSKRHSLRLDQIAKTTGFDEYYGLEDYPILLDYPAVGAASFGWDHETLQFLEWRLQRISAPFLAFLFTGTMHNPYPEPPKMLQKYPHGVNHQHDFLNTLYYTDWAVGQFLAQAKQQPWFDDTVFLISADHTKGGDGNDLLGKFHVPLLMYSPKHIQPERIHRVASQLDLLPTMLHYMGSRRPFSALGHALQEQHQPFAMLTSNVVVGAVNDSASLTHTLKNRLQEKGEKKEVERLEQQLLLYNQLSYEALQANRWAD